MKNTRLFFFLCAVLLSMHIYARQIDAQEALSKAGHQFFIENKGQWPAEVLYLTRMGGLDVWITKRGVNYTFYRLDKKESLRMQSAEQSRGKFDHNPEDYTLLGHRVLMDYLGANPQPAVEGREKQSAYYNYFIGNDPAKHASNVALYKEVLVKDLYPGIDIRYYFDKGYLRYDYVVHPGADPSIIQIKLRGQYDAYVKGKDLIYTTRFGEVQISDLYTYQGSKTIESRFEKKGEVWQIALGSYDKTQVLIIDPLIYSTYLGGGSKDKGMGIAVDAAGNAYVTGCTASAISYEVTPGAFQNEYSGGGLDAFVTKLNATGTGLVYSTYLGGVKNDVGGGIAVDAAGNVYVTGWTNSTDYPVTPRAFQTTYEGRREYYDDVFVTKLNATGTALVYSTYIGGVGNDEGSGIAVDAAGNAYVTGWTNSDDYDTTPGAFQTTHGGRYDNRDVFVTKLNPTGTRLVYSTYLGGVKNDIGGGIAVDAAGNVYVTGWTNSTNYPVTRGAFQTKKKGRGYGDAFVTKLNATGTALLYSTYIGGREGDGGYGIAVDASGNAYVTGATNSTNYPVTRGAFQTKKKERGYGYDAFVTKLNATGTALVYSTYIGGVGNDEGSGIAVDAAGNAYVTGRTFSTNYPVTRGAFQTWKGRGYYDVYDVFVTKLNATGTALVYSTYIGGREGDRGNGIAVDAAGNAYVTGETNCTDYDVTPGAFQSTYGGSGDAFVIKLDCK